jgi:hypothetical protein
LRCGWQRRQCTRASPLSLPFSLEAAGGGCEREGRCCRRVTSGRVRRTLACRGSVGLLACRCVEEENRAGGRVAAIHYRVSTGRQTRRTEPVKQTVNQKRRGHGMLSGRRVEDPLSPQNPHNNRRVFVPQRVQVPAFSGRECDEIN